MPIFTYKALDQAGKETTGTLPAENRASAVNLVVQQGLYPVSAEQQQEAAAAEAPRRTGLLARVRRVSPASAEAFTRELSNLLTAGVSLSRALRILTREASQEAVRKQRTAIHDDVVGGMSLADALAKWPRSFPPVHVAMVRAGEMGGFLDVVLGQIADFRSRERDLKGKVKSAMVYPTVLAVLAAVVLVFLLTYFIPRFSVVFAEFGGTLPWLTRLIISVSEMVIKYGFIILIVTILTVVVVRRLLTSESGRRALERAMLRLPGVGVVVARFALVRFCRMLGTLAGAGVPLVAALRVAREAIGNQTLADAVSRAIDDVQHGKSLARSLTGDSQLFPPSVIEMVAVAEESGRLDRELLRLAEAYERELDSRLRMLVAVVEPALLFIMASVVGTVVIGMLLPVFTLQELIR